MPYLLVVLALILLVILHELGHFLAARAVGIRATKFYVFFPPALLKRRVGEVEYGLGAIPAGGFVKLPGMFEPEALETRDRARWMLEGVLEHSPPEARLQADAALRRMVSAPDPDALRAPLQELHDMLAELREQSPSDLEQDAWRARVDKARTRMEGLLDDCHPRAYWRASLSRRMAVIFAGPLVNLVVAFLVLTAFYWTFIPRYELQGPLQVRQVEPGSPADRAGIEKGDSIVRWNGPVIGADPGELSERISERRETVRLAWEDEAGTRHSETVRPRQVGDEERPRVGLALGVTGPEDVEVVGRRGLGFVGGMRTALAEMREITWGNLSRLPRVFFDQEVRDDVGSVVGIVQVAQDVDRAGQFLRYVGVISLVLAVMNLLPLLPLDGGHLLFGLLEAARRGRPLPRAAFERYSFVGLALVLMLFAIGVDNDIARSRA